MKKTILKITILFMIAIIITLPINAATEYSSAKAKVIKNNGIEEVKKENGTTQKIQKVKLRILEGEYENEEYEMEYVLSEDIQNSHISNTELEENDNLYIEIEETDGEVTKLVYQKTIEPTIYLYLAMAICLLLIIVIGRTKAIKPIFLYILTMALVYAIFIFSIKNSWNLILVSMGMSSIIIAITIILINGINQKTLWVIICSLLGTAFSTMIIYVLFDAIQLTDPTFSIQLLGVPTNLKEFLCACFLLLSSGIVSSIGITIILYDLLKESRTSYKRKSDNIIEGQRSLKL